MGRREERQAKLVGSRTGSRFRGCPIWEHHPRSLARPWPQSSSTTITSLVFWEVLHGRVHFPSLFYPSSSHFTWIQVSVRSKNLFTTLKYFSSVLYVNWNNIHNTQVYIGCEFTEKNSVARTNCYLPGSISENCPLSTVLHLPQPNFYIFCKKSAAASLNFTYHHHFFFHLSHTTYFLPLLIPHIFFHLSHAT